VIVVGLGNPGPKYATTRHNVGFMVVDLIGERSGGVQFRSKFHGELAEARLGASTATLLKPLTYMNNSGRSVQAALAFFKLPATELMVVHDELDLPFGDIRLKAGGGDAGHNGLKSITQHLGTSEYPRLRFGIGKPPPGFRGGGADFVLEGFGPAEKAELGQLVERAADAVELVAKHGLAAAMNTTNRR
jgi:peptidyl-tRNA hydrolase, PTH1 family